MAITPTAAQLSILELNVAMFGQAVGTTAMAAALPTFKDGNTYAQSLVTTSDAYKILSSEQAFTKVINNLSAGTGVTTAQVDALAKGMVAFVNAGLTVGATINLLTAFLYNNAGKLTGDAAIWNNAGTQLVNKTAGAAFYTLDQNQAAASADAIANISYRTGTDATSVSFQLTTANETFIGGAGNDTFYAVAGAAVGQQDQTTLNSGDSMAGGLGDDVMYVNMVGNYNGGAMIHGIETLRLGTAGAVAFDYNVNEGQPQVADVTKIVYDQINAGETMAVNNVLRTTDSVVPTLAWYNDSIGSRAGIASMMFRASQLTGTTDNQNIDLGNVNNGVLINARGFETFTVTNTATSARNTLAASQIDNAGAATQQADLVSDALTYNAATGVFTTDGVNNTSTLTKVILNTTAEIGDKGRVITGLVTNANVGLVDHGAAIDLGINNGPTTGSNLLSVAATVTEVDATLATAATNVRFTPRVDGTAVNVTFKGGSAADYVEFETGNVTATGNKGDDIFAFNTAASTNAGFTSADVLTGGEGTDTIQLGLNAGAGATGGTVNYVLNTTEFNNKTGIEALDLRGARSQVSLSDSFVAAADTGTFTVYSNKIAQASDTDASNSTSTVSAVAHNAETGSVHDIDITALGANRAINIIGGTGTEVVVVDNDAMNQSTTITAGTNSDNVNNRGVAGRNDAIVFVNGGTFDANDLSKVTGIDLFDLVQNTSSTDTWNFTLNETFMRGVRSTTSGALAADTLAMRGSQLFNNGSGGPSGAVLAANDTVNIDVTDFYDATGAFRATALGNAAFLNLADLVASGATITMYRVANGVQTNVFTAAAGNVTLNGTTFANAGVPVGTGGVTTTVTGVNGSTGMTAFGDTVTGVAAFTVDTLAGADTINTAGFAASITGGAGADTVNYQTAEANINATLGDGDDIFNVAIDTDTGGHTFTGGAGTDTVNINVDIADAAVNLNTATVERINITAAQTAANAITLLDATNGIQVTASATANVTLAAANQTFIGTAGAHTVTGVGGNDTITITSTTSGTFTGAAGTDTISVTGANHSVNAGTGADTVTLGSGVDTYVFTAGDSGAPSATVFDLINGFQANRDIIDESAGALVLSADATQAAGRASISGAGVCAFNAADNTLALKIVAAENGLSAGGAAAREIAVFEDAGASYLFISDGVAGVGANDVMIRLAGVTGVTGITLTGGNATLIF